MLFIYFWITTLPLVSRGQLIVLRSLRVLALAGAGLATALSAHAASMQVDHGRVRSLSDIPAGLVAAMANTAAKRVVHNPVFAIAGDGCAALHDKTFKGCFGARGAKFTRGEMGVRLRLTAWGRSHRLRVVTLRRGAPVANRVEYRGKDIAEWWRVLPMGYEQGFTIKKTPAGRGKVVLQLHASTAPRERGGELAWGKLRYGKLQVIDARGRAMPATINVHAKTITLAFDTTHAQYPVRVDPLVWVQQEVSASGGAGDDHFGYSVALSPDGSTALVGATQYDNLSSTAYGPGAAYIYSLNVSGGTWRQVAELTASNGAAGDKFGESVALSKSGSIALIGAPCATYSTTCGNGAAYVYTMPSGGWGSATAAEAILTASNGVAGDQFGASVALASNGATALIGASCHPVGSGACGPGAAYIFEEPSPGGWATTSTDTAELVASDGVSGDGFGQSVSFSSSGATALIGASCHPNSSSGCGPGEAYVYSSASSPLWTGTPIQTILTASDGVAGDLFGDSVALSGDGGTALVGADCAHYSSANVYSNYCGNGLGYVFAMPGGGWATTSSITTYTAELAASDGAAGDQFGVGVALSNNGATALIGADQKMDSTTATGDVGAAYLYTAPSGGWSSAAATQTELTANDGAAYDYFGNAVALSSSGTTTLVGADGKQIGQNASQGAAYLLIGSNLSSVLNAPTWELYGTNFDSKYTVTNNSTSPSADIKVALPLPGYGATYVSTSSSTGGTCKYDSTAKVDNCDLGAIAGGSAASATLTLNATAVGGDISQSAWLTEGAPDLSKAANTFVPEVPKLENLTSVTVTSPNPGSETFIAYASGTVTLTASSSNQTLLPNANIGGVSTCTIGDTNCTLTLTPAAGATGTATVSLKMTDTYGQTATGSFTFTVNGSSGSTTGGTSGSGTTSSSSSGGGGGAVGLWALLGLLGLTVLSRRSERRLRNPGQS